MIVAMETVAVTLTTTNSLGQEQTIVSQAVAEAGSSAALVVTNSNGVAETISTHLNGVTGSSATVVATNSLGVVETIVVAANQLIPSGSTYVSTNSKGEVRTLTTAIYAIVGSLTTDTTTNSLGQTQTIVTQLADSSQIRYTTTTHYTSLVATTNADGGISSFSAVIIETVVLSTMPPQTAIATETSTAQASATNPAALVLSKHEKVIDIKYSSQVYVLAMYFPPLFAVIAKAMWEMVFAAVKLIQPFERMNTELGSDGKYSIFAQYLSSSISLDALTSLSHGNPLTLLSGILYIFGQIGPPLYAASSTIRARSVCSYADGHEQRCDPVWVVNSLLLRVSQAIAGLCLIIILLMVWSIRQNQSGVASDPSSLASLATLMNYEPLLNDLQGIGSDADHSSFEAALDQHRFLLDYHSDSVGQNNYGIIGLKDRDSDHRLPELDSRAASTVHSRNIKRQQYNYSSIQSATAATTSSYNRTSFTSRQRKHLITDLYGLLFPFTLFTLVVTFYFDQSDDVLNRFFNSNTLAPKFLLVTLATLSSLHLSHLERLVRICEPFRRLTSNERRPHLNSKGRCMGLARSSSGPIVPPETTLLITRSGTPYSTLPFNILLVAKYEFRGGKMLFQTLLSFTAILSDVNIIAVAGVPLNDAMTWNSYQLSSKVSIAITAWVILAYGLVLGWWRRTAAVRYIGGRNISKDVGTVGGCMRWLCGGEAGMDVIEALTRVQEGMEIWRELSKSNGGEGEIVDWTGVWFGRTGNVGSDGREMWSLMCDTGDGRRKSTLVQGVTIHS